MRRYPLFLVSMVFAVAGCTAKKHIDQHQSFAEADRNFRQGSLSLAVDQFREMLDQYPFSEHNEEAELKIAHAHYLDGNYPEALVALTDFQRRHPTSPYLPFVGYCLGMCYVQQMGSVDTDQTAAQNAQTYFLTVSRQYPNSPFAELARQELAHCRERLAEHELYVANFYGKRENYKAAEIRLLTLASRYGDTPSSATGLMQLAKLYRQRNDQDHAALAYVAVTQMHPKSAQAKRARRALAKLANADPPSGDALDLLLAANGRRRTAETLEPVPLPSIETARARRSPGFAGPGFGQNMDPFGRNRPY